MLKSSLSKISLLSLVRVSCVIAAVAMLSLATTGCNDETKVVAKKNQDGGTTPVNPGPDGGLPVNPGPDGGVPLADAGIQ